MNSFEFTNMHLAKESIFTAKRSLLKSGEIEKYHTDDNKNTNNCPTCVNPFFTFFFE